MHFSAFENAYFLQSTGWAIVNSFWQTGLLWLLYIIATSVNKRSSAIFKYNLALLFLFAGLAWFGFTIAQTYFFLKGSTPVPGTLLGAVEVVSFKQLNNLLPYLSFSYAALLCFYSIKFINSYQKINSLQKSELIKAPLDLRMFTKNIALHIGIKRKVQVWLSQQIDVPSVIGFIKPVILLPAAIINHLTTDQLEAVLLHELAHVKRNDYFINLLQSIAEIILFFNPFANLLSKYARYERENCCDDWVINYQYNKHQYAGALLILEEQRKQHLLLAMAATNKKEVLLKRVKRMFSADARTSFSRIQKFQVSFVCLFLLAGILFLLPFNKRASSNKIAITKNIHLFTNQPTAIAYPISNKEMVAIEPAYAPLFAKPVISKRAIKKYRTNKDDNNYSIMLINDGLWKKDKMTAITANEKENTDSSYYVKVEEQQSGDKQMNVYYFQLKKNRGKTSVKPLILMRKPFEMDKKVIKDSSLLKTVTL